MRIEKTPWHFWHSSMMRNAQASFYHTGTAHRLECMHRTQLEIESAMRLHSCQSWATSWIGATQRKHDSKKWEALGFEEWCFQSALNPACAALIGAIEHLMKAAASICFASNVASNCKDLEYTENTRQKPTPGLWRDQDQALVRVAPMEFALSN